IPTLFAMNAMFYNFNNPNMLDDIASLWELFETALDYASSPTTENRNKIIQLFSHAIAMRGNGLSKITMGLYWIAPDSFLNLDSRNRWFIYESGKIPESVTEKLPIIENGVVTGENYIEIIEIIRDYLKSDETELRDFVDLSAEAWRYSEEVNKERQEEAKRVEEEIKRNAAADENVETAHYWIYSPGQNAECWDEFYNNGIMAIGWDIDDLTKFSSKDEIKQALRERYNSDLTYMNAAHAVWQFANEMKPGDIVFVKKGTQQIVGRGVVSSDYYYDDSRENYKHVRKVNWTHNGNWPHPGQAVMKALTDITQYTEYVNKLNALFDGEIEDAETEEVNYPDYSEDQFLSEVYMSKENYEKLTSLLRRKKNIILCGAPGVGKTFAAQRLAYSMMGKKDKDRTKMVQFHQSYSYEDFIMGYRPTESGFERKSGTFYDFCKKAELDDENDYFFIIDEINRGNLSKIFGELFTLIENDKRGTSLRLLYSDEMFSIPSNVFIIGMMNTADRSLAMLDYALRRRFAFFDIKPGFNTDGFKEYQDNLSSTKFDNLISCVKRLNVAISNDFGKGFCIGHSYFCNLEEATDDILSGIVEYEIIPLLEEYWFDEPEKVNNWSLELRSSIR
ncbi:AAA family ATPase, partial [Candidatus Saccharibacteria bacterium]|nr:AAA family ATPase [Candidatus Saccharibacteria bacterium]